MKRGYVCCLHNSFMFHMFIKGVSLFLGEFVRERKSGFPGRSLFHSVLCVTWNPQMFLQVKDFTCFNSLIIPQSLRKSFQKSNTLNRVIIRLIAHACECTGSRGGCWGPFFSLLLLLLVFFFLFSFFNATDGLPGRPLGEGPTQADWRKG